MACPAAESPPGIAPPGLCAVIATALYSGTGGCVSWSSCLVRGGMAEFEGCCGGEGEGEEGVVGEELENTGESRDDGGERKQVVVKREVEDREGET